MNADLEKLARECALRIFEGTYGRAFDMKDEEDANDAHNAALTIHRFFRQVRDQAFEEALDAIEEQASVDHPRLKLSNGYVHTPSTMKRIRALKSKP